jgi:hypothetical protein
VKATVMYSTPAHRSSMLWAGMLFILQLPLCGNSDLVDDHHSLPALDDNSRDASSYAKKDESRNFKGKKEFHFFTKKKKNSSNPGKDDVNVCEQHQKSLRKNKKSLSSEQTSRDGEKR